MKQKPTPEQTRQLAMKISAELADRGLIIEGGFASLAMMAYQDTSPEQVTILREVFFAGAHHLFNSIAEGITNRDMERMQKINDELDNFLTDFKRRHGLAQ